MAAFFEEEIGWEGTGEGAAFVGEGGFFEGDDVAFGVGPLISVESDETGASERVEKGVKDFAVGGWRAAECAGGELGVEFAGGAGLSVECTEDGAELAFLF